MKVLLVSPYSDIASIGLRIISAYIRKRGHEVLMVFLPHTPAEEERIRDDEQHYPESVTATLSELAAESDIAGITLMTNYVYRARILTKIIKTRKDIPVVWGGIHPTIRPEDGSGYADYCIVGEGEEAFAEVLDALQENRPLRHISNLFIPHPDSPVRNPPRPLIQELDTLPFPDYGPENHYIWDRDAHGLVPMTMTLLQKHLALGPISRIRGDTTYQTLATRGCPHRCAYCCNDVLQELYQGQKHLRRRSDDNVIEELKTVRKRYPFIQAVGFSDDSFFAAPETRIETFARRYKKEIGLPFFCLGSPTTITEKKLVNLLDAGMFGLQMGVQTGSTRIQSIYNRHISNDKVLSAVKLLNRYAHRMVPPSYDFIIDVPWETQQDIIDTLQLIRSFPRPYRLQLFSLVIFPGTALYERARKEGLLTPNDERLYTKEYHVRKASYANIVLSAYRHPIPKPILDFLSHPAMVHLLNRSWLSPLYAFFYKLGHLLNRYILKNR